MQVERDHLIHLSACLSILPRVATVSNAWKQPAVMFPQMTRHRTTAETAAGSPILAAFFGRMAGRKGGVLFLGAFAGGGLVARLASWRVTFVAHRCDGLDCSRFEMNGHIALDH